MSTKALIALLILVALLGGAAWWQQRREASGAFDVDRPLLQDYLRERTVALRIDNLERGLQMKLAPDERGLWQILDPVAYPAEGAVVEFLLQCLSTNRATAIERPDLAKLQLDPPRAVLEVTEKLPTGERVRRLEVGALDLDGRHVAVRVDGVVLSTLRNLDSTLDRDLAEWRRLALLEISPEQVIEVHRTGSIALDDPSQPVDMRLDLGSDEGGWRMSTPRKALCDPVPVGTLVAKACSLNVKNFLEDAPGNLGMFGLEHPDLTLELVTAQGARELVILRREGAHGTWIARREGSPHVVRVDHQDVVFLCFPPEALYDSQLARARRDAISKVRLVHGGGETVLERLGTAWKVSRTGAGQAASPATGDDAAIGDLLGALEHMSMLRFEPDLQMPAMLVAQGLWITVGGREIGGDLGPEHTASDGARGALFRRGGDDLVWLAPLELETLVSTPVEELLDRQIVKLPEVAVTRIELQGAGKSRAYVRNSKGRWSREGIDAEAREFLKVVERVLSVRSERSASAAETEGMSDLVAVRILDAGSQVTSYELGRAPSAPSGTPGEERVFIVRGERRGLLANPALHRDLLELLRAD
jgi:uncharacterized protein DUF4340